jgi:hypothetical protein
VTVAVVTATGPLDLRHETRLVKAALLYADHVTLASAKAAMLTGITNFNTADRRARADALMDLFGQREEGREAAELYKGLRRREKSLSPGDRLTLRRLERAAEANDGELVAKIDEVMQSSGSIELAAAIRAGVVDIHGLGNDRIASSGVDLRALGDDQGQDLDLVNMVKAMSALLGESVSDTARTFPLLDDGAGEMVREMLELGKLVDPQRLHATEVGIAGRLIGQLPTFPDADMDVILDVRNRLHPSLVRFRSALAKASGLFESAAWEESFAPEVDDLYRRDVAPALREVEETLDELGVRRTLNRLVAGKEAPTSITTTLALVAANGVAHMDLPALLFGASPTVGAIAASASEFAERHRIHQQAERNAFYFLYDATRKLLR